MDESVVSDPGTLSKETFRERVKTFSLRSLKSDNATLPSKLVDFKADISFDKDETVALRDYFFQEQRVLADQTVKRGRG